MSYSIKTKFSLKDELYNPQKIAMISHEIKEVYPTFQLDAFSQEVLEKFPKLELKERIYHIRDMLHKYLPDDYKEAVNILLQALPAELDPYKSDDDFGDFIYAPYSEYVTAFGCTEEHLDFSLSALREITKRFSAEYAIRDFINNYPTQTLVILEACAKSENYHERRLASEGLRGKLPWAKKLTIHYAEPMRHLELLYTDKTRYVTRSVANHLNDISKIDAKLVLESLKRWQKSKKQEPKEMDFIINHALRTLVKQGNSEALAMLGYEKEPAITVKDVVFKTQSVKVGEALEFEVEIEALDDVKLMVDYIIHFRTKKGTLSPKVHKLKKLTLKKGESIILKKRHPFKANMTTRTLYAGEHLVEVQINGTIVSKKTFILKVQYNIDMHGEFADIFKKCRDILLIFPQIKEVKNAKQTSYSDEYSVIVMMRTKGDAFVVAFGKGTKLQEKYPQLQGNGKIVRHLYFKSLDDVDEALLREMIEESFVLGLEAYEMKELRKLL